MAGRSTGGWAWVLAAVTTSVFLHVLVLLIPIRSSDTASLEQADRAVLLELTSEMGGVTTSSSREIEEQKPAKGAARRPTEVPRAPLDAPSETALDKHSGADVAVTESVAEDKSPKAVEPEIATDPLHDLAEATRHRDRGEDPASPPDSASPKAPFVDPFPREVLSELASEHGSRKRHAPDRGVTVREPAGDVSPNERAARAERRIADMALDDKARHRVATGLIDPYFVRLREAFEEEMDPDWEHLHEGDGEGLIADLAAWLRDHQGAMERYAKTGSPYHTGETSSIGPDNPLGRPIAPAGTLADPQRDSRVAMVRHGMRMTLFMDMAAGRAGGVEMIAVLRVVQSPNGGLLRVEVERSSGRPVYDDHARLAVRSALARRDPPARAGRGLGLTSGTIESVWAFRTRFVVVPPSPVTGCELESDGAVGDCLRPLQRRIIPNVELEAVY